MRTPALALALGLVLLAGCLQLPEDATDRAEQEIDERTGGTMTGEESRSDDVGLCTDGLSLDERRFCATRTITLTGAISGFRSLDVALETFNGDIDVEAGGEGKWGLVATLKARGSSAESASAALDEIDFAWAHERAGGHFLEASADHDSDLNDLSAELLLTTPRSLVLTLVAATSNGDVTLTDVPTDNAALATSNGDIVAKGEVTQVSLTTSNGGIDATLRPTADTRWVLATSNGDVKLAVPEGPDYGYSIEGTTSNGEVDYTLKDGKKGECPQGSEYYTPPCSHRTFETSGFRSRDIQVSATLTTSNGQVDAGPA